MVRQPTSVLFEEVVSFRTILSDYRFSPRKDLERNNHTGVLHLSNKGHFGLDRGVARIDEMEQAIVNYFISRDEDSVRVVRRTALPISRVQPSASRRRFHLLSIFNQLFQSDIPIIQPKPRRRVRRTAFY
jgi:hypothetical protein